VKRKEKRKKEKIILVRLWNRLFLSHLMREREGMKNTGGKGASVGERN